MAAVVASWSLVGPERICPVPQLRKLGQFMAKVRSMAAEFRASFDEMARQSELDELRKEVEAMRQSTMSDIATHAPEVNQAFNDVSQGLSDVGVRLQRAGPHACTMRCGPDRTRRNPAAQDGAGEEGCGEEARHDGGEDDRGQQTRPAKTSVAKPPTAKPKAAAKAVPRKG